MQGRRVTGRGSVATLGAVLLVLTVLLGACGDSGGDSSSAKRAMRVDQAERATSGAVQTTDAGRRSVIRTATLRIEVRSPDAGADEARKLADESGGYLAGADAEGEGSDRTSTVTLRVPEDRFDSVLAEIDRLGEVQERSIRSDDVTDRIADLQGRSENAQTSAKRLRELLAQAGDIDTIVTLEERLTKREAEIESLAGQIAGLDDEAELSSIEVTFEPQRSTEDPGISRDLPGPLRALRAGFVALVNVLQVLLVVAGFALPFAAIGLLGLFGYRAWRRRHPRPVRAAIPAGTPWSPPPPPASWTPGMVPGAPAPPSPARGSVADELSPAPHGADVDPDGG